MIFYGGVTLVEYWYYVSCYIVQVFLHWVWRECKCCMVLIHMQYSKQCITLLIIEELREQIDEIKYIKLTILNVIGLKSFTNII